MPTDLEIARHAELLPITTVAAGMGSKSGSLSTTAGSGAGRPAAATVRPCPMEDFNLHLTGDTHAVTAARNMLSAMLDNHLHYGNALGIDIRNITWRRVLDVNDRALRNIVIGLGSRNDGVTRQTGFDIACRAG